MQELKDISDKYVVLISKLHVWPDRAFVIRYSRKRGEDVYVVNTTGAYILKECDGQKTVSEIAQLMTKYFKVDYHQALKEIIAFLNSLTPEKAELIFSDKPIPHSIEVTGDSEASYPVHVSVEITYKCNLMCKHCYAEASPERIEIMSFENWQSLLKQFQAIGVDAIEITGGEPMVHPQIALFLSEAFKYNFSLVGILSNGYYIPASVISVIKETSQTWPKKFFQIDLDGVDEDYIDWFKGVKGCAKQIKKNIIKLSSEGVRIHAVMNLTPYNLKQIQATAKLAKELGASSFGISVVELFGRAKTYEDLLIRNEEQLEYFANRFKELKELYGDFIFIPPERERRVFGTRCGAGSTSIAITPTGKIKICPLSSPETFCFGNIDDPLKDIFKSSTIRKFAKIIPPEQEVCGDCEKLSWCKGCLHKGIEEGRKLKDKCNWYYRYFSD